MIRYAQCWEDADVLLEALDLRPDDTCLSIASAGDNTLSLLTRDPARVIAVDRNPAQLACLELRVAAYRLLNHDELLELIGSRPSRRRRELYERCASLLTPTARAVWEGQPRLDELGIGGVGRFERYLALFRRRFLPLAHNGSRIDRLLAPTDTAERRRFYNAQWNSWRWRMLFKVFFSRRIMGLLGRDARSFRYADGKVATPILERTRYALTELNPADNPYVHWILRGRHSGTLPHALRPENFETIRANLDRLEWHCTSLDDYLRGAGANSIDRFNLSDVFESFSEADYHRALSEIIRAGRPGGRAAYWNMLVPRHRPAHLADRLRSLRELAERLHGSDKAFFYNDFIIEEFGTSASPLFA